MKIRMSMLNIIEHKVFRFTVVVVAALLAVPSCQRFDTLPEPQSVVSYDAGARPRAIATADLDGDGALDVAVANSADGTVSVLVGVGDGRLRPAGGSPFPAGREPSDVDAADLDRDGDVDLAFANHETSRVSVWLAGRDGFSQARGSPFPVRGATEVATGDLDGDGVADVAVGPWDGDEVAVLSGRELTVRKVRTCERPIGLAIADLDGDRRGELLAACANHNRLVVVTMLVSR